MWNSTHHHDATELLASVTPTDGVRASWSPLRGPNSTFNGRQPSQWAPGSSIQAELWAWLWGQELKEAQKS